MNAQANDQKIVDIVGVYGRDAGKKYRIVEMFKLSAAGLALRLLASLHVDSYEELIEELKDAEDSGVPAIDKVMQVLQGCEAERVETIMREALTTMQVAPDPQHPEAFRALTAADISEMKTLGTLLVAFGKLNLSTGV
jgi:hypothetical protein